MIALLEIVQTLATYSQWRDGCPDCGSENPVRDQGDGRLRCFNEISRTEYRRWTDVRYCHRSWIRGEV